MTSQSPRQEPPRPSGGPARSGLPLPFQRNLLRSPNPEGVNISEPAPQDAPRMSPDTQGIFSDWQTRIEPLPTDGEKVPLGLVSPHYRWCVREQLIDLLAEGLWEELLDSYQPRITVMDWYENSKLASSVYELHVQLLGTDRALIIAEFQYVSGESEEDGEKRNWCQVSHVFKHYGPGVRFVHFLQKTKDVETPAGYRRTRATDSSVSVQLWD
ncbi:F-box only protein 50 [Tiliqua scincoides]|uniref:F-box only protein 50 n=1 Tax=Tiliqua scincoides TaxID=71010 RepID=UPI003462C721